MIDTIVAMSGVLASVGIGAGVYYKLGKLTEKVDLIYRSCDITVTFKKKDDDGPRRVG